MLKIFHLLNFEISKNRIFYYVAILENSNYNSHLFISLGKAHCVSIVLHIHTS